MKALRIGIMSQEKIRARTIDIAKGEYKPKNTDPKAWFPSMKALSEVLSDHNRELLKVIADRRPDSIKQLSDMTGRKANNLTRTLNTILFKTLVVAGISVLSLSMRLKRRRAGLP